MSAIAGILSLTDRPVNRQELETITHPVPGNRIDALNVWNEDRIGFGHALARVTPESFYEEQPLVDSVSGCVITFDGRLDNRDELRQALARHAHLIDPPTDPALVLAAFLEWQTECPRHLIGDFAFAIWDPRARLLLLARDPLGQRCLFYRVNEEHILFASTLEQLLASPAIPRDLDDEALALYCYSVGNVGERTPYRAIKSLLGGSRLVIREGVVKVDDYWQWQEEPPAPGRLTQDHIAEFRSLFAQSVGARLRSQEPVGLLLSGGLDSSSVACMAGHLHGETGSPHVWSYSFVFDKFQSADERPYITSSVSRYEFPNTQILSDECWPFSRLDQWLPVFSEPFFAPFDAMQYITLARARGDGIRTMLMGHGGDSLLDGSPRYFADLLLARRWRDLHRQLRAYSASSRRPYWISFAGNALSPLFPLWARRMIEYRRGPDPSSFIHPRLRGRHLDAPPRLYRGRNAWWYALQNIVTSFGHTPNEAHIDRLMRLFGIEVRQPFLDVRLLKFILRLPPEAAYSDGTRRQILRQALRDILPPPIRDRTDKATFAPLMEYGLRERRRAFVQALLKDSELARREYVQGPAWQMAIEGYLSGNGILYWTYWYGLVLEIWLRYLTGRLPSLNATN